MDPNLTTILNSLKTISKLEDGEKLAFSGNDVSIQPDSYIVTPIRRWWHKQSQTVTIAELEKLLSQVNNYIDRILNSPDKVNLNNTDSSCYDQEQIENVSSNLTRIQQALKDASNRLGKLMKTYQRNPQTVSKLENIQEEFAITYKRIVKKLEKIESHQHRSVLSASAVSPPISPPSKNTKTEPKDTQSSALDVLLNTEVSRAINKTADEHPIPPRERKLPPIGPVTQHTGKTRMISTSISKQRNADDSMSQKPKQI